MITLFKKVFLLLLQVIVATKQLTRKKSLFSTTPSNWDKMACCLLFHYISHSCIHTYVLILIEKYCAPTYVQSIRKFVFAKFLAINNQLIH